MRTLNFRLMSVLLTVLFVTVLAVAGVNIGFTANTVLANGQTALQIRAEKEANAIDGWVKKLIATIDTNAIQTGIILGNYDGDIYSLAPKYAEIAEQVGIFDCYFGVPDGNCVFGSGWLPDYSAGWASYKRPWYIAATENPGQTIITDPYIDAQTGEVCYTFAKTISDDAGKTIGVFAIDALLGDVTKIIEDAATFDDTASAFLIQPNGDILIHTDESFNPTMDANEEIVLQNLYDDKDFETYKNNSIFSANGHFYAVTDISSTNWKLFVSVDRSSIIRPVIISFMVGLLVFAVLFIISAALVMLVIRKYATNPIKEVEAAAKQLASGETTVVVSPQSTLEMQNLADAFRAVCANSSRQEEVLVKVADGDLTVEHTLLSERDTMGMALQKMLDNLNNMFSEINSSASMVSEGAKQIANGSQSLAQGASEQTASVDRLSSTITEITARTTENADIAREAAELSDTIKRSAEKGSAQMEQMMQAVKDINEASGQINKVIKVIDDIAFQTNILALNAAVEAARAGQHGKGFAVVADEVRNLAAKSADAAKDTGGLIENSIEKANLGYNIAIETSASLKEIVEGINRSAEIVAQIAQSSDSQASAIAQISTGINQVAQVVQQNSATAEESASASAEMNGQSNTLTNLVSQFQLKNA